MHSPSDTLRRGLAAGTLLLAGMCLAGCAHVYDVKVDAMKNPEVQSGHSYRVVPKDPTLAQRDPNYRRAEEMVNKALAGHGMYPAENPDTAEVVVEIDYQVGSRRVEVETVPSVPLTRPPTPYWYPPDVGSATVVHPLSEKKLTIVAREGPGAPKDASERPPRELWRVEVRTDDEATSVSEALPVLVGAAVDHIGTDTSAQQVKRVSENSEPVNFVKGGS